MIRWLLDPAVASAAFALFALALIVSQWEAIR
jgi:hypothetical protein